MAAPTRTTRDFEATSLALEKACREQDGVVGLVLLGSAAEKSRRDEWSDHDFFIMLDPAATATRDDLSWLPESERIVITASEGEIGRAVVYDDGHLFEFAIATEPELSGARVNANRIVYDEGPTEHVISAALARNDPAELNDDESLALNHANLFLIKLLVGVGRVRRGEVTSGARFIRTWAVDQLLLAIRSRMPASAQPYRDNLDPLRRLEKDLPELGTTIEDALARPAEDAARRLLEIAHETLQPGWAAFPTAAADAIARRLGWS